MIQGSQEWHEYRAGKFNASEAGAVMGVNPWFPRNPAELFDIKTGAAAVQENAAMRRGTELEPEALAALENASGMQFTPAVRQKGRYSASLDGIDFNEVIAAEIKCPMRADSKLFDCQTPADIKSAAPHYWWQMVHQQYVAGCARILFLAYHPDGGQTCVSIDADQLAADRDALLEAWERFGKALDANERPEPPVAEREDEEWQQAVAAFIAAKEAKKSIEEQEKIARDALIELAGGRPSKGCGVHVLEIERAGNVDYAKIPELKGVDLDRYRKKPTRYWSVK